MNQPGFFEANGEGLYEQTIDTTQLSEGVHYITSRVFRHRDPNTFTDGDPSLAGDGGPAVYTDFREAIYVDRLPPEAEIVSFDPFGEDFQRDLVVRSTDGTADSMHVFINLPAEAFTDQEIYNFALNGQGGTGFYDRDEFVQGVSVVRSGNTVATVVTIEPTGNFSVQRFPGLFAQTSIGLGFGDLNFNNQWSPEDLIDTPFSFETVLNSQNMLFSPAADVTGDGLVDYADLFALGDFLATAGVNMPTWDAYETLLLRTADLNQDGMSDASDIDFLYDQFGSTDTLLDLNGDGMVDSSDLDVLIFDVFQSLYGDACLLYTSPSPRDATLSRMPSSA